MACNLRAYAELRRLLDRFDRQRVPVVLLKGSALAVTLYTDIALRPMGDIDILTPQPDLRRVVAILTGQGYHCRYPEWVEGVQQGVLGERRFVHAGKRACPVEAHFRISGPYRFFRREPVDWFWRSTMSIMVDGFSARVFTPEAQLLHLALHLALHGFGTRLLWSYDIALLLARCASQIQWEQVTEAAQRLGLAQVLKMALARVELAWGVGLPPAARVQVDSCKATVRERISLAVLVAGLSGSRSVIKRSGTVRYLAQTLSPNNGYRWTRTVHE